MCLPLKLESRYADIYYAYYRSVAENVAMAWDMNSSVMDLEEKVHVFEYSATP